ncbi:protealysin inhibitor emfourin [Compostimonas suwonensis]|uniref:Uncharacterized protein n=1 Tax=Compostimonas suwonensis TaxID=1048394 RepID=A0A2M9BTW4_9MICO|nr:protealysin inhibitor emfourin [Compostimonas suwonensis]PJJ61389.1 hypothetical protein CLV54_2334 [Compostimonas suwonensis]
MKVFVHRSGGFAGLGRTWEVRVDEQPDASDWIDLLDGLPWDDVAPPPRDADRYTYRIRCAPHEATLAETQLTGAWRELVDRVQDAAGQARQSR